ncbi:MAG: hypothetical protein ACLTZT_19100 [Butyricimonas faecalis]
MERLFTYQMQRYDLETRVRLDATGTSAEALELMEEIKEKYNFKSAEYNDQYVRLLEKNGYQSMVIPTIIASIRKMPLLPKC